MKFIALGVMLGAVFALLALAPSTRTSVNAAGDAGNPLPPLLTCPNVDGSAENKVQVADILTVVQKYGRDYGEAGYAYLYDSVSPYNKEDPTATGGISINDILYVVQRYNLTCPVVDTQVALAAKWAIQNVPMNEDPTALAAIGYYRGSSDVPGQGVHYINLNNWDGTFNPQAPEGLVYDDGKLAAQLYVTDGNNPSIGWGTYAASSCCPGAEHGIDLEGTAGGPECSPACSWNGGYDGWHLHYYLCTVGIGTTGAVAIPGSFVPSIGSSKANCQDYSGGGFGPPNEPECTVPITTTPCYRWGKEVGWMGHLWSFLPNGNLIPDVGSTQNGRYADCYPDGQGWKAFNCPA